MTTDNNLDLLDSEELDILDTTLDEIEDLPGFDVPYNGRYLLKCNPKIKTIADKACVEVELEVMECVKKDNDSDKDTPIGTKFSQLFFLQGEEDSVKISMGLLKQFVAPFAERSGNGNLKAIIKDQLPDALILATCVRRKDNKNPEIFRARLSNIELA